MQRSKRRTYTVGDHLPQQRPCEHLVVRKGYYLGIIQISLCA